METAATIDQTAAIEEGASPRKKRWLILGALGLIVLLAAFLRFYELGTYGIGNSYYGATVKSMLSSWKNFFFASYEPGGSVTVDKPPLGLWIQAASAYFLGVNGFALALPQVIAGILSIPLLYHLVKRPFGEGAGLLAALALAIVPATIATERNNTMDGLLVFVLLLAAWAFIESVRQGRMRYLLLGAFIVGLGFNIKMLQALMPLPGFYALCFFGAPHKWWKRILHLVAATALLVVVSLAWAVAVDLTPAEDRPYVGSSDDNSMIGLILGHNGVSRLIGGALRGPDGAAGTDGPISPDGLAAGPNDGGQQFPPQGDGFNRPNPPNGIRQGQLPNSSLPPLGPPPGGFQGGNQPAAPHDGPQGPRPPLPGNTGNLGPGNPGPANDQRPGGFNQEVGDAGALRMFTAPLADEASWLLPFSLLGVPLLLAVLGVRWPLNEKQLSVILWAGWLLPCVIYFSFTTGLFHAYYVVMLGPPMAALVGATAWALHKVNRERSGRGWILIGLLTAATILVQAFIIISFPEYAWPVILAGFLLWLVGFALLALQTRNRTQKAAYALLIAAVAVAPMVWSFATTFNPGASMGLPNAGPPTDGRARPIASSELNDKQEIILDYLLENTDPEGYLVATASSQTASPYIIATGRPVLTFGGFSGRDDVISVEGLEQMVNDGELRFIIADGSLQNQKPEIAAWVQRNCSVVNLPGLRIDTPQAGQGRSPEGEGLLYDCAASLAQQEGSDGYTQ